MTGPTARDELTRAVQAILPETIDAELPSAITSSNPMAGIERLKRIGDRWETLRAALAAARSEAPGELDAEAWATLDRAFAIGQVSFDGDSWFAADAGYGYDEAEATMNAARNILARLREARS